MYTFRFNAGDTHRAVESTIYWWVWRESNSRPHPYQGCALNRLSYRPDTIQIVRALYCIYTLFSLKEVIQPQVPLGLPCYDFTPVMNHSVVIALPKVRLTTSGATHSHGVTGGVYKARERIHRGVLIRDY